MWSIVSLISSVKYSPIQKFFSDLSAGRTTVIPEDSLSQSSQRMKLLSPQWPNVAFQTKFDRGPPAALCYVGNPPICNNWKT